MKRIFPLLVFLHAFGFAVGQTCTSIPATVSSATDFSSLGWSATGGAICPPSNPATGDIILNIANNITVTLTADYTINGDFLVFGGPGAVLFIPAGVDVHVAGDMGDDSNNGITYHVDGTLRVDGTLYGKNDNSFIGTGQISGGSLSVKNGAVCSTPCPVYGGFDDCDAGNDGGAALCDAALPVRLLYFDAQVVDASVELSWATSMEEDFYKFVIQRSNDLTFEDIGEVEGRGFNIYEVESKYSFIDEAPFAGRNYYRLKAVDLDDSFEYFPVKMAEVQGARRIAVYPNPSLGEGISFRTNFHPDEADRLILTDQLGVTVFDGLARSIDGSITFHRKLTPGVYLLKYRSSDFEQVSKIVIQN